MSGFPKDIDTGIQYRVRHHMQGFPDREIVRSNLTEIQATSLAKRLLELAPVVEARLITVGEWGDPAEAEAALVAGDDRQGPDEDDS